MPEDNKNIIWYFKKSRKTQIIFLVAVLLVAIALSGYYFFRSEFQEEEPTLVINSSGQKLERRSLDGVYVVPERANLFPVAVAVENLNTIRPQAGLAQANLIYEALAEGGITRFLVVYAGGDSVKKIWPVRSARPYFLDWVKELKALFVHAGGSPEALRKISEYQIFNLNQISGDHAYFWREKLAGRAPEHTLFTSSELLSYALRDKQAPQEGNFEKWNYKEDADVALRPSEEKNITIDFSSFNYKVEFKYNREKNDYLRYQGGEVAKSQEESGEVELRAKNVMVQFVDTHLADESRLGMKTIGEGEALVFQDGKAIKGNWKKDNLEARTFFFDEEGKEISFNAGQSWIEILPTGRNVEYN